MHPDCLQSTVLLVLGMEIDLKGHRKQRMKSWEWGLELRAGAAAATLSPDGMESGGRGNSPERLSLWVWLSPVGHTCGLFNYKNQKKIPTYCLSLCELTFLSHCNQKILN